MELIPINVKNMIKDIKINIEKHKKRNMNQYHLCPETLNQMELLVELKLFAKWGRTGKTGTHNMYNDKEDTIEGRWKAFLSKEHGDNVDYRGLKDTLFEGVQIIYNEKTKKIVTNKLNKGTFDFISPNKNPMGHFENDVKPWLAWGNVVEDHKKDLIMDKNIIKSLELIHTLETKMNMSVQEGYQKIVSIMKPIIKTFVR